MKQENSNKKRVTLNKEERLVLSGFLLAISVFAKKLAKDLLESPEMTEKGGIEDE